MTIIGIDPGVHGAVAVIADEPGVRYQGPVAGWRAVAWPPCRVVDIPTFAIKRSGRSRTEYDANGCANIVRNMMRQHGDVRIWLEDVRPRPIRDDKKTDGPRDSLVSARSMGVSVGIWLGIAGALGLACELVAPVVWKRKMGLLKCNKEASRAKAIQMWPNLADQLTRKMDHNRAEALLIAAYGQHLQQTGA